MKTSSLIPLSFCLALLISCSKDDGIGEQPSIPSDPTATPDGSAGPSLATVKYSDFLKWDDCDKLNFDTWRVVSQEGKTIWTYSPSGSIWQSSLPTISINGGHSLSIVTDSLSFRPGDLMFHHYTEIGRITSSSTEMNLDCSALVSGAKAYLTLASTGEPFGFEYCELLEFDDTSATLMFVGRLFFNNKLSDMVYFRHVETVELELDMRRLDVLK